MPTIKLTIDGKKAIGDGTQIVCMNKDYEVDIEYKNCDKLVALPIKKLVVKHGREYKEVDVSDLRNAILPPIEYPGNVELGVYGKERSEDEPEFTTIPAIFECAKSVLCGAEILKTVPKLISLTVDKNQTLYKAKEGPYFADGFNEVDVSIPFKGEVPAKDVELFFTKDTNIQQVTPPNDELYTLSYVEIKKPNTLVPENIKKGVTIAGIAGTYDIPKQHKHLKIDANSTHYIAPEDGYLLDSVTVEVGVYNALSPDYVPISITSFVTSTTSVDYGNSVSSLNLDWRLNKAPKSLVIYQNGVRCKEVNNAGATGRAGIGFNTAIVDDITWTLVVTDEAGIIRERNSYTSLKYKAYYTCTADYTFPDKSPTEFTSVSMDKSGADVTFNADDGEYVYYFSPIALGELKFTVNGIIGGFANVGTIKLSDGIEYYIYRSDHDSLGTFTATIKPKY